MIDPNEVTAEPITAVTPSDFERMYEAQKLQTEQLRAVIAAAKLNPDQVVKSESRPVKSAEQIKSQLGQLAMHNLTREQKLATLGVNDPTVTDGLLRKLFGRGNDGKAAKDLMLVSKSRYLLLRECALMTDAYGT